MNLSLDIELLSSFSQYKSESWIEEIFILNVSLLLKVLTYCSVDAML